MVALGEGVCSPGPSISRDGNNWEGVAGVVILHKDGNGVKDPRGIAKVVI